MSTRAPWRATLAGSASQGCAVWSGDKLIAIIQGDIDECRADARLIAAAPEMRALAQEALHIALVHKLPQFEQRCRAAIAKAEGAS